MRLGLLAHLKGCPGGGGSPLPDSFMGHWQAQPLSSELLHDVAGGYTRIGTMDLLRGTKTGAIVFVVDSCRCCLCKKQVHLAWAEGGGRGARSQAEDA